jgi:hypothetical protein
MREINETPELHVDTPRLRGVSVNPDHFVEEDCSISHLHDLEAVFSESLLLGDPYIIRILMASVVANRLLGDPFWIFLIAPPSGLKTELILSLSGLPYIYPLSDLTARTFASGMKDANDASLLPKLKPGTILALKDFTTILCMQRDSRREILSQLREIYDGSFVKVWGTGKTLDWKGKLGLVAGVTSIIDTHYSIYTVLGERFVQYRIQQPNPVEAAKIAIQNQGREAKIRARLREAVTQFVKGLDLTVVPDIPKSTSDKLAELAAFVVQARSGVIRDAYGNKDIEYVPDIEAPARLAKQLCVFIRALQLIGVKDEYDRYQITVRLASHSIHKTRLSIIGLLYLENDTLSTTEIADTFRCPTKTIRRYLEDLAGLRIIRRIKQEPPEPDLWILLDGIVSQIKSAECGLPLIEVAASLNYSPA